MLNYCKKCGRIILNSNNDPDYKCDICESKMYPVPEKYWLGGRDSLITNDSKKLLQEELVKTSLEFDQYLFTNRDKIMREKEAKINVAMSHGKTIIEENSRLPKCPTCQSTNIRKMSGLETGTSVAMFGLFSRKINKTFKCNKCGMTW